MATNNQKIQQNLGWGLQSQFPPFRYFRHFPLLSRQSLAIEYHVYIWQVSPQLSCGDTCQIWMWFRESNRYFCKIENFAYGEISERSLVTPTPEHQCWLLVNVVLSFKLFLTKIWNNFCLKHSNDNVVCKKLIILFKPRCAKDFIEREMKYIEIKLAVYSAKNISHNSKNELNWIWFIYNSLPLSHAGPVNVPMHTQRPKAQ